MTEANESDRKWLCQQMSIFGCLHQKGGVLHARDYNWDLYILPLTSLGSP